MQALLTYVNPGVTDAIKTKWDTGRLPHFFEMLGFSDLVVLAGAWDRGRREFDDELEVLGEKLELRKVEYVRECRELTGRSTKVEQIFLKIRGVDDSHLEGRVPETRASGPADTQGGHAALCGDLAIEEEERMEMEGAIAAIKATTLDPSPTSSGKGGDTLERDQYTAFVPLALAYRVEHTSTAFGHAIWKMDTFNHLAPISVRALQFLGGVTEEQVKQCRAQILKGKLKYCGRVSPLDPQDLKFPPMCELDLDKCGDTNSGMWQKGIRQEGKHDLRTLRKGCTHVITLDSSITDSPLLHNIINEGLNHIPCMALDVEEAIAELGKFLDKLFVRIMKLRDLTDSTRSFLRRIILKGAKGKMERYRETHRHITAEPFEHPVVKRELAFLTSKFLICPTDKAPNTPAFVCKSFIGKLAFQRLSGPEFASIPMPPAAVVSLIRGELSAFRALPATATSLPYLMAVLKAHKGTFRWITNTANTVISLAADVCACLLRFLLPLVQAFCRDRSLEVEEQHGVRPNLWWTISSVGEFYANLPRKVYSVFTADITRCFETILTDSSEDNLTAAVRFYVQCAMQVRRERSSNHAILIRFGEGGGLRPTWVDVEQPKEMGSLLLKEGDICWLSEWCIANNILCMGEYV
ncbi:hypothetical protein CBR_g615 [Chara braunii]|uniref:Uncharacterized protein n=1 Tax=Chara braunii TaxID=69332 RepID=A0A388KBQ8_CHABU|nr:hypothetical protein CBR_g615 [Chara braunii]|eukprot:GBG67480.1 hypothetical protein CBR_g615 [Chara braunii]